MVADVKPPESTTANTYARLTDSRLRIVLCTIIVLLIVSYVINLVSGLPNISQRLSDSVLEDPDPANTYAVANIPVKSFVALYYVILLLQNFSFTCLGLLLFFKRSDDLLALILSMFLLSFAIIDLPYKLPNFFYAIYFLLGIIAVFFLIYLFPNGHYAPRWLRIFILPYSILLILMLLAMQDVTQVNVIFSLILIIWVIGLGGQLFRLLHTSHPAQKQQQKLAVIAFGVPILAHAGLVVLFLLQIPFPLDFISIIILHEGSLLIMALVLTLAVLRYRLWDIDLAINRGMVGTGITMILGVIFFAVLFALQTLFQTILGQSQTTLAAAFAAGIVVVLFQPTHKRVRHFVDYRIYGLRVGLNELKPPKLPQIENPGKLSGTSLGRYQVLDLLGKGGMGEVYQAQVESQRVALKVLPLEQQDSTELRQRLEHEARILARLQHDHIVRVFDLGESDGIVYLAQEFIDGQTLQSRLKEHEKFIWEQISDWVGDLTDALDYAHQQGCIHRDLKPANVMFHHDAHTASEKIVLMDFGIAKLRDSTTHLTHTGNVVGTMAYMAPEQIQASKLIDHRADIYAFGIMLYELLTGERPFQGEIAQILFAHLYQPPPTPHHLYPEIPRHVSQVILRALEKKPEDRFASMQDLNQALFKPSSALLEEDLLVAHPPDLIDVVRVVSIPRRKKKA